MKTTLFCCSFLFLANMLIAQPPERIKAKIITGLMGGQIDGDQLAGYNHPGLIAGMAMEMKLAKIISVQPEIMYNQKGARSTDKSLYYAVVRLNYIDLCGLFNFYLKDKLLLQSGLSYGLLYKAKVDRGGGFVIDNQFFNSTDACILFGVEYKFTPRTAVNIRSGYSLASISPISNWYNNTLSFSLRFVLGN